MRIKVSTTNCDPTKHFCFEGDARSKIEIIIECENIVSAQSKKERQNQISDLIQNELSQFTWLIVGSVEIEMGWFLNSIERNETDKIGDMDNISKPILDSLAGQKGILVDDSQIGSIHTFWMSRNYIVADNVLSLTISFNNDTCLGRKNLFFIRYYSAICSAVSIDKSDSRYLSLMLEVMKIKLSVRESVANSGLPDSQKESMLADTAYDFHRTRLSSFDRSLIIDLPEFEKLCKK